tara:strand:+ start:1615 stop:1986 length:372 start_codon:yes stop_codon:yes gene_type:complete
MPKKKLVKIAEEQEVEFDEAMRIALEKLPEGSLTGRGKNTWVSEEGAYILEGSFMIEEIIPKHYKGKVLSECPNPRYNYVYSKEIGKRVPVLIPSRHKGRMVGKVITFEAIEDNGGVSYRYAK